MIYKEKYFAEFIEQPIKGLKEPCLYRISFRVPDFSGTPTELQVYRDDTPAKSRKTTSEPDRILIWHPRRLDIKLRAQDFWQSRDFYVDSDRAMQVVLLQDQTRMGLNYIFTKFIGFVLPVDLVERYGKKPYPIEVSAVCGLSTLKDRPLVDANNKRLQDTVSLSIVLRMAFAQTGLNLPMVTGVNLFEHSLFDPSELVDGKIDLSRCPLFETTIHSDRLINDNGDTISCEDAIRLCFNYQVRIGQANGRWYVIRANEAGGGWDAGDNATDQTMHLRTYASTDLYEGPTSALHESVDLSVLSYIDLPVRVKANDPILRLSPVYPGVRVDQEFGRYRNRANADWALVDQTKLPIGWKRQNISSENAFQGGSGTDDDPFYIQLNGSGDEKINSDTPCIRTYIEYDQNAPSFKKPKRYRIRGRFKLQTARKAKLYVKFFADKGEGFVANQMLQASGTLLQNPSKKQMVGILIDHSTIINGQMRSKNGFAEFDILSDPISDVVSMDMWVCIPEALDILDSEGHSQGPNPGPPQPWVRQYAITVQVEEEGVNLKGTQVTVTKTKQVIDSLATFKIGDVLDPASPTERIGTMFRRKTGIPTTRHYHPTDVSRANGMPLLNWAATGQAQQRMQPIQNFEGTLAGDLPFDLHTIIRFKDIVENTAIYTPDWTAGPLRSISFQFLLTNRITPSNYLPLLRVGDKILISGSSSNDGVYTVATLGLNTNRNWYFTVVEPINGETATNSVTIAAISNPSVSIQKPVPFQITSLETDYRACEHEVISQQIVNKPFKPLPQPQQFWLDQDGNQQPLEVDDSDVVVTLPDSTRDASLAAGVIRQLGAAGKLVKTQSVIAGLDGHTPITNSKNSLEIYNGTTLLGTVKAAFRKQIDLSKL